MKTIKRRHMGRDVIQGPHEQEAESPLNISEYNRIADYGTICYPHYEDMCRWPDARAIVFFHVPEEQYILAVDEEGGLYPSCKALFGGFVWMRGGKRIYFGPGMNAPLVPENMLTRDGEEHKNRDLTPPQNIVLSDEDMKALEEQIEADDQAMTERRRAKDHFETGDRAQYLTPKLMPDEVREILVTGKFYGFLQMTNRKMPHAMVFEVGHPSRADELKKKMIVPLPAGCRFEEEEDPWICQEAEMEAESFMQPEALAGVEVEHLDDDVPYDEAHSFQGGSSDAHHGTPEDQAEGHRPLDE